MWKDKQNTGLYASKLFILPNANWISILPRESNRNRHIFTGLQLAYLPKKVMSRMLASPSLTLGERTPIEFNFRISSQGRCACCLGRVSFSSSRLQMWKRSTVHLRHCAQVYIYERLKLYWNTCWYMYATRKNSDRSLSEVQVSEEGSLIRTLAARWCKLQVVDPLETQETHRNTCWQTRGPDLDDLYRCFTPDFKGLSMGQHMTKIMTGSFFMHAHSERAEAN